MSTATAAVPMPRRDAPRIGVVLCGSYRRDPRGLRAAFDALTAQFQVLSPQSLDFVDSSAEFVRLPDEADEPSPRIEHRHLDAIRSADLIWLHAPGGYVGPSAAMELGYARALGIPVFTDNEVADEILGDGVTVVPGIESIESSYLRSAGHPGGGLSRLQHYYKVVAEHRGWAAEDARDTLLLLTEEVGELARAIRRSAGLSRHQLNEEHEDVSGELADVQLYVVHLANTLGLDLSHAVMAKERVNAERFTSIKVAGRS